jgi:hypothetical protein
MFPGLWSFAYCIALQALRYDDVDLQNFYAALRQSQACRRVYADAPCWQYKELVEVYTHMFQFFHRIDTVSRAESRRYGELVGVYEQLKT